MQSSYDRRELNNPAIVGGAEVHLVPSNKPAKRWFSISLPVLLVLLPLAILVPLIAFSLFSLGQFASSLRSIDEIRILGRARSVSANVDRDIRGLISAAAALGTSRMLAQGDLEAFYDQAKQAMNYAQANVLLLDLALQQLLNTRVPYGTPLPKSSAPPETREVIDRQTVYVSDLFVGKVSGVLVFNVTMPVVIEGRVRYVLIITAESSRMQALLEQQELPEGWHAAIGDRAGKVIASTDPALRDRRVAFQRQDFERPDGMAGSTPGITIRDQGTIASDHRSTLTGWTTTVWAPHAVLEAPLAATWRNLYAASLLAISLSALLAYFFSLPLASLIRQTLGAAAAIGKAAPLPPINTFLTEGRTIQSTLAAADAQLRERQRVAEEGKALLDTLLEHIPEGVTIVGGPDLRVVANSKKAVEWIGKPEAELKVLADEHAAAFGIWFPDGVTRPEIQQLPLYRASRHGESVEEEYFSVKRPDGTQLTIEVSVNPVRDASGRIIGAVSCWRDVTQRFLVDKVIADNEKRLTLALEVAGMAIVDMNLQGGVVAGLTNGKAVLGFEIDAGEAIETAMPRFLAAVHPADRQKVGDKQRQAMTNAGPFADEFRVVHSDGSVVWIETRGETLADEQGKPVRVLGANVDMTARKRSEEHLRLVMRELTHRAKNLLAIIAALATQTAKRNTTLEEFQQAFSRRIQGLAASHDLLVKTDWTGAPLEDLVFFQIAPFGGLDGTRIAASGPPVNLKPDALQNLGLAINELATNAMKYGALSVPEGTIRIAWSVDRTGEEPRFRMSWTERGGPPVKPPRRKGFGHVIIETSLGQVLGGAVKLDYASKGVTWTVDAPFNAITPAQ